VFAISVGEIGIAASPSKINTQEAAKYGALPFCELIPSMNRSPFQFDGLMIALLPVIAPGTGTLSLI
jgi:hypothetical protein